MINYRQPSYFQQVPQQQGITDLGERPDTGWGGQRFRQAPPRGLQLGGNLPPQQTTNFPSLGGNQPPQQVGYPQLGGNQPPQMAAYPQFGGQLPQQSMSPYGRAVGSALSQMGNLWPRSAQYGRFGGYR